MIIYFDLTWNSNCHKLKTVEYTNGDDKVIIFMWFIEFKQSWHIMAGPLKSYTVVSKIQDLMNVFHCFCSLQLRSDHQQQVRYLWDRKQFWHLFELEINEYKTWLFLYRKKKILAEWKLNILNISSTQHNILILAIILNILSI